MSDVQDDIEPAVIDDDGDWGEVKPDAMRLLTGGRVMLRCLGTEYLLRPPTNKVVHDTQLAIRDILEEQNRCTAELSTIEARIRADAGDDASDDDVYDAARKISTELADRIDEMQHATLQVVAHVVEQLGLGAPSVAVESLPAWCAQVDVVTDLITHWRRVPRVPGR